MEDKKFRRLLAVITSVGILFTAGLVTYTFCIRENTSILTFISNE